MIKIKILEYIQQDGKTYITLMWADGTVLPYKFEGYISKEDAVHDTYIIGQHMPRQNYEGEIPTTAEDWEPNPVPTVLKITDWNNLTAKVYDQYGSEMEVSPQWSVEGVGATIEDGKIVENTVSVDTPYTIIAAVGNLSERQERIAYAPVPSKPSETEILEAKLKASTDRQDFLEELIAEMAMKVYE